MTIRTITYNPETHVLVPREPTAEMVEAGFRGIANAPDLDGIVTQFTPAAYESYSAMIAAAPQPDPVESEPVIDLEHVAYNRLVEAACKSKWIPKEYYANDWINDCINFLINGQAQPDRVKELEAEILSLTMELTPNRQSERIAELEAALKVARDALNTCTHEGFCDYDDATEALAKINEVLK